MDFSAIKGVTLPGNLEVKKMQHGNDVLWKSGGDEEDYSKKSFFVKNNTSTAGTVTITRTGTSSSLANFDVYGSTDNTEWTLLGTTSTSGITATLPANGRLYLRATTGRWGYNASNYVKILSDVNHDVCGNILSLLYGSDFSQYTTMPSNTYVFYSVFEGDNYLISAKNLVLPSNLGGNYCYRRMFYGCSSLTTAPELPATTLVTGCYNSMFQNCSSLNYIKAFFTTTPSTSYTANWVSGVAATGTFIKSATATWSVTGVNGIPEGWTIINSLPEAETEPFYVQNETDTDGVVNISIYRNAPALRVYTSTDNVNWVDIGSTSSASTHTQQIATLPANGRVYLRVKASAWCSTSADYNALFANVNYSIGGNIMSLIYGDDNYDNYSSFTSTYTFYSAFANSRLVSAENLVFPQTTTDYCYRRLFENSTSLVKAPKILPATTLSAECYEMMFNGCTSLATVPELPATELVYNCYSSMFSGCTSLATAPELPATTLVNGCYNYMFRNCTSLNYIKAMFTTTPGTSYTKNWVNGVAATGTFVKNDYAEWNVSGGNGVPSGWTIVSNRYIPLYIEDASGSENTLSISKGYTDAPSITVQISGNNSTWTTLGTTSDTPLTYTIPANGRVYLRATANQWATSSSKYNFINCSGSFNAGGNIMSLLYGSNYSSQTSFGTYQYVFERLFGVVSKCKIVSAEKLVLPSTTITYECYGRMFMGSDLEKAPKMLPATSLGASYCYSYMFADCKNLTTVPTLPATTLKLQCYSYMFRGCTSLVEVPDNLLPATTLQQLCYTNMFYGCTSLERAPKLPATALANACYQQMFYNCSSLNYIKAMFTTTPSTTYTSSWVRGVSATGTFVKNSSATWNVTGTSGIPSGWTVETAAS